MIQLSKIERLFVFPRSRSRNRNNTHDQRKLPLKAKSTHHGFYQDLGQPVRPVAAQGPATGRPGATAGAAAAAEMASHSCHSSACTRAPGTEPRSPGTEPRRPWSLRLHAHI